MKVPYRISDRSISLLIDNRMRVIDRSNANYDRLAAELRRPMHDIPLLSGLADITRFVALATHGKVQIGDDAVRWNGEVIHNVIVDRLLAMLKAGDDLEPLANFLGRLMHNPSEVARNELYLWLEAGDAPITSDGYFLAFKAVRPDYTDKHTGKISNSVGQCPSMPRDLVDPDRHRTCSRGLHFCQYGYLGSFGGPGDHIMILKIDPADVVAIPSDYNNQKGRATQYLVVGEVPAEEAATIWGGRVVDDRWNRPAPLPVVEDEEAETELPPDVAAQNEAMELSASPPSSFQNGNVVDGFGEVDTSMANVLNNAMQSQIADSPPAPSEPGLNFQTRDGRAFSQQTILREVDRLGTRGFAKQYDLPRSTAHDWFKRAKAA